MMLALQGAARPVVPPGDVQSGGALPLAPHPAAPPALRRKILENQRTWQCQQEKRRLAQAHALGRLREEFLRRRVRVIGEANYQRYREFLRDQARRRAKALLPPAGLRMSHDARRALQQRSKQASSAFLRKLGVDLRRLATLNREARDAVVKEIGRGAPRPGRIGPVTPAGGPTPFGDFAVYHPSYDNIGWWTEHVQESTPFATLHPDSKSDEDFGSLLFPGFHFADKHQGALGHMSGLEVWNPDEHDVGSSLYMSLLGFWYQMPKTAKLGVRVHATPTTTLDPCTLFDETDLPTDDCDSFTTHDHEMVLWLPQEEVQVRSAVSHFEVIGGTEGQWSADYFPDKTAKVLFHVATDKTFQEGEWVWLWVGTSTLVQMFVNQVAGLSHAAFCWKFTQVAIGPKT
jgi:hypothetical protein